MSEEKLQLLIIKELELFYVWTSNLKSLTQANLP